MELELDERQRAMLQEMGVHVWWPASATADVVADAVPVARAALAPAAQAPRMQSERPAPMPRSPLSTPTQAPAPTVAVQLAPDADWATLQHTVAACQACGLCAGRKNTTLQPPLVAGQADWLLVGDPPDEDEDRLGQPFVEAAGQLLDNMLKAVGASRTGTGAQGAYATNVLKCRPPHGRLPQASELAQCETYLQRELALVQPKVIVAMGRFAIALLLAEHPEQATLPLGKQRGQVYRYRGVPVVVSYAPKVLLRASADKAKAWADLCLAMDVVQGVV